MTVSRRITTALLAAAVSLGAIGSAHAAESRTVCAYDPAGKAGDYYRTLDAWATEASGWGHEIEIKAYTDEETATKDYQAGVCDGVVATGVRLQRFNRFASTIEAIGALPEYSHLHQLVDAFVKYPSSAKYLRNNDNETVGILPVGKVYLFVRDKNIDTVAELAGKRIATLDYDEPSKKMVERVGAIMVPADLGTLGPKFNNGDVDACYATAPIYKPFELHRGIGTTGGIVKLPLAQATLQIMVRHERFSADFGTKSRAWWSTNFGKALAMVEKAEAAIPADAWITIPADKHPDFDDMFGKVRAQLSGAGSYDSKMLSTMKKIRCASDSSRSECAG
ncbi:MAG: hypothetical protein ACI8PZ_003326 [Myxococcota bacterium]|jgi:hypothetical protein